MPAIVMTAVFLAFAALRSGEAADRLRVTTPPLGQESATELVESAAAACNRGDFIAFMGHFTPTHSARIRKRMEEIFVKHEPTMTIHQVTLLAETDDTITFGVRYAWHDRGGPEHVFASKLVARRIADAWKLDGEQVKDITRTGRESSASGDVEALPVRWNPFNPPADQIDPALERLRGDIGIRPGRGCADGRCGL